MSGVRLLVNTNLGRKGDIVDDPNGYLVKSRMAKAIGVASKKVEDVEVEVSDGSDKSEHRPEGVKGKGSKEA